MTQEETLILDILLWLAKAGEAKGAAPSLQGKEQNVRSYIVSHFPYSAAEKVEATARRIRTGEIELDEIEDRCAYIILPPAEQDGGFIPIIRVKYDRSPEPAEMRIVIGLFLFNQFQGNRPCSVGFRCEPSEGEGHHDYFHAQFIHHLDRRTESSQLTWPTYVPTSQPAFPLHADSPLTLLFSTLMAIYGKRFLLRDFLPDFKSNDYLMAQLGNWPPIAR